MVTNLDPPSPSILYINLSKRKNTSVSSQACCIQTGNKINFIRNFFDESILNLIKERNLKNCICIRFFPGIRGLVEIVINLVELLVCVVLLGICGFVGISRSRKSQKLRKFQMCVFFSLGYVDSLKWLFLALVE